MAEGRAFRLLGCGCGAIALLTLPNGENMVTLNEKMTLEEVLRYAYLNAKTDLERHLACRLEKSQEELEEAEGEIDALNKRIGDLT